MKIKWLIGALALTAMLTQAEEVKKVSYSVATQLSSRIKYEDNGNLQGSFIRGEITAYNKTDDGVEATFRLRAQDDIDSVSKLVQIRKAWFKLPLVKDMLTFQSGRWYDSYYKSDVYFGRYLYGVKETGSGSMLTNYSVQDGFKLITNIDAAKTIFDLALLPQDKHFEGLVLMPRAEVKPIKDLTLNVGGSFDLRKAEGKANQKAIAAAEMGLAEDLAVRAQVGVVDFSDVGNNTWVTGGIVVPTAKIFDSFAIEAEYKEDKGGDLPSFAWMVVVKKKALGVSFDLDLGVDPSAGGLKSTNSSDFGGTLRMTKGF